MTIKYDQYDNKTIIEINNLLNEIKSQSGSIFTSDDGGLSNNIIRRVRIFQGIKFETNFPILKLALLSP